LPDPIRGELWFGFLDPTIGHEQGGKRPLLVLSDDNFNRSGAGLVIVAPLTSRDKRMPWHVSVDPPEGNLKIRSYIKCEDIRSVSKLRLTHHLGEVDPSTTDEVEYRLKLLLSLS